MANVWAVSCGSDNEYQELWPKWRKGKYVAIGYGVKFPLVKENGKGLTAAEITNRGKGKGVTARGGNLVFNFAFKINVNDYIVVKKGNYSVLGMAKVMGNIQYSEEELFREGRMWHTFRRVEWIGNTFETPGKIDIQKNFLRDGVEDLHVGIKADDKGRFCVSNFRNDNDRGGMELKRMQSILERLELA
jgi:hypothetical protein